MKAMILAAGRGERMRPLTDRIPKPLLQINGRPMIEYLIESLEKAGIHELVINLAHLGNQLKSALKDGKQFNVSIEYSMEGTVGLETGGGIFNALKLLGTEPFIVVNGDIFTGFDFERLCNRTIDLAHLVLVPNPPHNAEGDFFLGDRNFVSCDNHPKLTFSGIGVYRPELFEGCVAGKFPLAPLLRNAMNHGGVSGELYTGVWMDIGTPQRLEYIDQNYQRLT